MLHYRGDAEGVVFRQSRPRYVELALNGAQLDVRLAHVYDLTHLPTQQAAGLALTDFVPASGHDTDEQRGFLQCQPVGALAHSRGFQAIRYPSATGRGENLAIFPDCLLESSHVAVVRSVSIREEEMRSILDAFRRD